MLWQRSVEFFQRYDLLIGPVTQVSPFAIEQEYPTEVDGQPMSSYIEWMRSNCRISSCGLPALSLPAGFTDAGLPVGAQIIGRPWGRRRRAAGGQGHRGRHRPRSALARSRRSHQLTAHY